MALLSSSGSTVHSFGAGQVKDLSPSVAMDLKPWPNGVASHRKLRNVSLCTRTYDGRPNGIASRRKFNASRKKAISVKPCRCARTKENNTETNLRRLALDGQPAENLRSLACKFELHQSERKSSQAIGSPRKSCPHGIAS